MEKKKGGIGRLLFWPLKNIMKIRFKKEKETKNTIRFVEVMEDKLYREKIGSLYVPKTTLDSIGWKDGAELTVKLEVKGG